MANELSKLLNTHVSIDKIDIGLLNRIIVDDLLIEDQLGKEMLKVTRLSAKFDIPSLLKGQISIGSVQLFGFNILLDKDSPNTDSNFQFIIDALAPKDKESNSNLDLRINSLLVRRGKLAYDVLSEEDTPGKFNSKHIKLHNIIGNLSLKALTNDSINVQIKRLSVDEQSGFELKKLSLKLLGNEQQMSIENFEIDLPSTSLQMDTIYMKYSGLDAFNNFLTDVHFSFKILPSHVTLQDIAPFIPIFNNFEEKINLELNAKGTIDQLDVPHLAINTGEQLRIKGNVSLQDLSNPHDAFVFGNLSQLSLNREGADFLFRNFSKNYEGVPKLISTLGNISFRGEISGYFTDLVTYGVFQTDLGTTNIDVKLSSDHSKGLFSYSGRLKTDHFEFGKWLNDEKWGDISFDLNVNNSRYKQQKYPFIIMKGLVSTVEYSNYEYNNILLDGEYKHGGFEGQFALNDPNGSILLNGNFNLSEKIPTFNFLADIKNLRPNELHLTPKFKESEVSLKLKANFIGGSIDEMIGTIDIDSIYYKAPEKEYHLDNFRILSTRDGGKNKLSVRSTFLVADIEGNYSYRTLPVSIMNIISNYIPALTTNSKTLITHNNLSFNINIYDTEILSTVFNIPIDIYNHSTIKGYFNDNTNRLRVEGYFPRFRYGNTFAESGMILVENPTNALQGRIRFSNYRKNDAINFSLDTQAQNNTLVTRMNWGNNATSTYSGDFLTESRFSRIEGGKSPLKAEIDIKPTDVILNDTIWKIHPSKIVADSGRIHIDNFNFEREGQYMKINGYASEHITDTVKVELQEINMGYLFEILNLVRSVDFKGSASGVAYANRVLKHPILNTRLFVRDFSFNDGLFGDMNIYGEWNQKEEGIYVDANIKEKDIANIDVKGYIYPLQPKSGLDLDIRPQNANLKFLELYAKGIVSNIQGRTSGRIRLHGPFSALNLEGSAQANATFKVDALNTYFTLEDSVRLVPDRMTVQEAKIYDQEGHFGRITGYLRHNYFSDMRYRIEAIVNNMLVMDTAEDPDFPFYGSVYATGNAVISGNDEQLRVDASLTTNRNTNLVYTMASSASAANNQFIKFVDKTPGKNQQDTIQLASAFELAHQRQMEDDDELELDMHLNIQVDATPDATVKIIMDPISGDYISAKGHGNVRTEYYNKGDVNMFGTYNLTQGVYKFSIQEIFRKDFIIKDGGSITFGGDPYEGIMDIQTVYTVNSASLTDLVPGEMLNKFSESVNRNVRVHCLMNLTGPLFSPTVKLDIDLPNESSETQNLVRNYIRTEEDVNMQILYLLAIGKFYTPDYVSTTQNSNMMTSVLSSTLSGQLNRILSQIIDNNNWVIGTNLSTGERGWTDVEVEGMLSGQLLNNRLLINGNFGYRDNPLANSNFVGDFEAEWLLTRSGDIRLKAYNETNDRYYTRTNLNTQGVGIIYRKDFNKWKDLHLWRRKLKYKNKLRTDSISAGVSNDSIKTE